MTASPTTPEGSLISRLRAEAEAAKDILGSLKLDDPGLLIVQQGILLLAELCGEAADALAGTRSERTRWISVSERVPESAGSYLTAIKPMLEDESFVKVQSYTPQAHPAISGWRSGRVTHWMPLPEAPK